MMRRKHPHMHRCLLVACLVIAGTVHADALFNVTLDMRDGVFTPATLVVPAGQKIKIIVRNVGASAAEFESVALRKEKVLAPGAQSFIVIAPLRAGRYTFFDDFHLNMPEGVIIAR